MKLLNNSPLSHSPILCLPRFVFLLIALFMIAIGNLKSQDKKITIKGKEIPIYQIFEQIENQSPYTIAYNRTQFDADEKITLFARDVSIKEALLIILNDRGWTYYIKDNHIIITKEKAIERMVQCIKGRVCDRLTGSPLPSALIITVDNPDKSAISDENGYFEIKNLPLGRYDIKATFLGYEPFVYREILLNSTNTPFVEMNLTEELVNLKEITVKSQNNKEQTLNPMVLAGGRMFSIEEASRYAGGFDDPARLITSFAGVSGGVGDNSVIIHGNAPHLLQWRLEGMEIANPNHFADLTTMGGGVFSSLSSAVLGNSDFLTGAYPAEYNNAFSGILDMRLRNGNNQHYKNSVQASIIGLDVASEGPLKKGKQGSYLFNYRNATFALIKKYIPDMEINNFGYQDLSFKLHFPYEKGFFSIWGLGLIDKNYEKIEKYTDEWNSQFAKMEVKGDQSMASGGITHSHFFQNKITLKSSLGVIYTNNNMKADSIELLEIPNLNLHNRSYTINASVNLNYRISAKHTNKSGITWSSMLYDYFYDRRDSWLYNELVQEKTSGQTGILSAFSNSLLRVNDRIKLNIGLNGQIFLLNRNWTIEPRLAFDYSMKSNHSFAFAYGLHSRLERLSTYFIEVDSDFPNKNLDFIKTHQFVLAYKWKISDSKLLKIEPYYHFLFDIPMISGTAFSTLNGLSFLINTPLLNEGKGQNKGIDLTFERYLSNGYYYLLTGSIFDSKYCDKDDNWFNTRYNYRFLFNILGGKEWIFGKRNQHALSSNAKFILNGGERYTPVNEEESLKQERLITYQDQMYGNQFDPKIRMDMTLSYKLNRRLTSHEFTFKLLNLTGVKEFSRFRYENQAIVKDEIKIILPNLSYKINF